MIIVISPLVTTRFPASINCRDICSFSTQCLDQFHLYQKPRFVMLFSILQLSCYLHGCFLKWWVFPPNHPILIGFSIRNHPFWGTPIFGNPHIGQALTIPCRHSRAIAGTSLARESRIEVRSRSCRIGSNRWQPWHFVAQTEVGTRTLPETNIAPIFRGYLYNKWTMYWLEQL